MHPYVVTNTSTGNIVATFETLDDATEYTVFNNGGFSIYEYGKLVHTSVKAKLGENVHAHVVPNMSRRADRVYAVIRLVEAPYMTSESIVAASLSEEIANDLKDSYSRIRPDRTYKVLPYKLS